MAKYPVKLLKDKDGTAFIPVVNSDSIITPEGDTLNDLLEEKQDLLTSGTNIKTINNESLLGSGNISIQGGGDATDVQVNGVSITQNNVANIVTQTAYNSLTNKIATKNDIPTQTSQLTNNSGYITSSVDNLTNYTKTNDLSEVATSGSYEDLSDKPTIPSKMSDLTNDNNFVSDASYVHTDNNYTSTEKNKLSGIASGAEVNVQSNWTETNTSSDAYIKNKPTIPTVNNATLTIQKNGTTVKTFTANASSNVTANITVPTKISDLTNDSGFVDNTYHDSSKQDTLVSGTNIKTINNTSILGSGNISLPQVTDSYSASTTDSYSCNYVNEIFEASSNKVTSLSSSSKDTQYPSAKCVYDNLATKQPVGNYLTSETDPTVPSHVKSITQTDITNWNNKSNFSGSYNDLTNKPTIPVVPTNISSFTNDSNYQNAKQVQTAINNAIGTALGGSY